MRMMNCRRQPYRKEDGELRSLSAHQHAHLKSVLTTGFFGHKDQVEMALHILRGSAMLETMKITPSHEIADFLRRSMWMAIELPQSLFAARTMAMLSMRPQREDGHGREVARGSPRRRGAPSSRRKDRRERRPKRWAYIYIVAELCHHC